MAVETDVYTAAKAGNRALLDEALSEAAARDGAVGGRPGALLRARGWSGGAGGDTALHEVCTWRPGGVGPNGWLGCIELMLREVGDHPDCAAWVNTPWSEAQPSTALHSLLRVTQRTSSLMMAAVTALLAYGADASLQDKDGCTPREVYTQYPWSKGAVTNLLRLAEELGDGREAIRRALATRQQRVAIFGAARWELFGTLPRLVELVREPRRVLVSLWSHQRELVRARSAPLKANALLQVWSQAPQGVVREVLLQLQEKQKKAPKKKRRRR